MQFIIVILNFHKWEIGIQVDTSAYSLEPAGFILTFQR